MKMSIKQIPKDLNQFAEMRKEGIDSPMALCAWLIALCVCMPERNLLASRLWIC